MNTLVVVCGLPGTGKTTVARELTERLDARLLRTDVVRKDLFDDPAYTETETEAVYAELLDRTTAALADGSVVLDATFRTEAFRTAAREAARSVDATFRLVSVECAEAVVRERIHARSDDASDADVAVYEQFRETYDPVGDADLVVDNSGELAATFGQLDPEF